MSKKPGCACGHSEELVDPSFEEMRAALDEQERIIEEQGLTGKVETFFGVGLTNGGEKIIVRAMWMEKGVEEK